MPSLRGTFTHLIGAVHEAAQLVQRAWIAAAQASPLFESEERAYVAGLLATNSLQHPYQGDSFQAQVQNVASNAGRVEDGTPAYHLPSVIDWDHTPAARLSARGVYYLFVPFRHMAPRYASHGTIPAAVKRQMMKESVYRRAKALQPGQYLTAGPTAGRARNAPGLQPYVPAYARNIRPGYTHAAREEGMRRYKERGRGRGGGSSYLTFRTITSASTGWWIPARPGTPIAATVQRDTADAVRTVLEAGAIEDVEAAVREQLGGITPS